MSELNQKFRDELVAYKAEHPAWQVIGFFECQFGLFQGLPQVGVVLVGDQPDASEVPPGALPHEIMALRGYDVNLGVLVKEVDGNFSLHSHEGLFYIGECRDLSEVPNIY